MEVNCPFCRVDAEEVVIEHDLVYARFDRYPVSRGHLLIIPKRHFADYFEATRDEKIAILDVVDRAKQFLDSGYHPDGYNIGVNIGKVAGQAVTHLHIHVIPRYKGDSRNHGGGMRRVIPGSVKGGKEHSSSPHRR
ncbi:MAG TPA: HIT family protein [Methanoregulaceae archaeon]|nr:HIT family protein [Methanoregulaceae archaeon]